MNYNEMTSSVEELIVRIACLEKGVANLKESLQVLADRLEKIENSEG